jgi:hypothetical protein
MRSRLAVTCVAVDPPRMNEAGGEVRHHDCNTVGQNRRPALLRLGSRNRDGAPVPQTDRAVRGQNILDNQRRDRICARHT